LPAVLHLAGYKTPQHDISDGYSSYFYTGVLLNLSNWVYIIRRLAFVTDPVRISLYCSWRFNVLFLCI